MPVYLPSDRIVNIFALFMAAFLLLSTPLPANAVADAEKKRCLYINSYHKGYDWSDGIDRGVKKVLQGKCELRIIYMDTKRNKSEVYLKSKGLEVKRFIDTWQPDVVIAADDNASKYVVAPYFRDSHIPFVFCGINWDGKLYGYPFRNATGMIEVAPVRLLFEQIQLIRPNIRKISYVGADTFTERKNLEKFQKLAERNHIEFDYVMPKTMAEWLAGYEKAQSADLVVLGGNSGITGWDDEVALRRVRKSVRTLVVATLDWMMNYAIFGMTKIPEEQGEWAARVALKILDGVDPSMIAVIPNRKWEMYVNIGLLKHSGIKMPESLLIKSKHVGND